MRGWAESVAQDVRFAVRMLLRKPVFSLVVIAMLALGIGLNAAIFSILEAVILRPLPYRDPARLTVIWQSSPQHRATGEWFNEYRVFEEWQRRSRSFTELAALTWATGRHTVLWHGRRQGVVALPVSANFFSMLGVQAQYGRVFEPRDAAGGCAVVLSYAYWRDRMGANRQIPGGMLTLDDRACEVAGVMPERFSFYPRQANMWTVITADSEFARNAWESQTGVFGRLRTGVSRTTAEQELTAIQASIAAERPQKTPLPPSVPVVLNMQQEFTWLTGRNLRQGLLLLSGAVALVLLIACVNVANLLLGRAAERQREMAIRASIGCGRERMIRQLLTESLVLSGCGAVSGIGLAALVLHIFRLVHPVELPPGNMVEMRWQVVLFAAGLAVACTLFCGVVPAWRASRTDLTVALKNDRHAGGWTPQWVARALVVMEVGLSLVLLSGATLLSASFMRFAVTPLGYRTDHRLIADLDLGGRAGDDAGKQRTADAVLTRIAGLPGVQSAAAMSSELPLGSDLLAVAGAKFDPRTAAHDVQSQSVSKDYFDTADVPLLTGRRFTASDRQDTAPVAMINARLAQLYFPAGNPVGRQIKLGSPQDKTAQWLTIVGVVGNVRTTTVFQEMGYVTEPVVYRPSSQTPGNATTLLVSTAAEPPGMIEKIEQAAASVNRDVAISNVETIEAMLREQSAQPRFRTVLLDGFAGMALLLAALGIYGLLAQQVIQRTMEIGIRMALGADRRRIVKQIVMQGLRLTVVGSVIGLAGSLAMRRVMASLLYETNATDPWLLSGVIAFLLCVALVASLVPAWRASRVDPMISMRAE